VSAVSSRSPGEEPLGILAGGGDFPLRLAQGAIRAGRPIFIVGIEGWADPRLLAGLPHAMERLGAASAILGHLRARGIRQVVLAGRASRPAMASLRPDALGVKLLARIGAAYFAGDDGLLKAAVHILNELGFEVLHVQAVLHDILPGPGLLGQATPDALARADIARGIAVVRALGGVDVGQGAVVQQGLVLAVEAIEGTDAMLARAGALRREGPGGVLVKLVKPGQDRRVDLPTIGPSTVEGAIAAGLRGIAIEAHGTIVVDREPMMRIADQAGLFVVAIRPDEFTKEEDRA
jgi:UDP-2,3-diacylglucosamine hydrolase